MLRVFGTEGDFAIDEVIVKADVGSVGTRIGIIDLVEMRPIDGTETHRARLTRTIDFTAREIKGLEFVTRLTDGIDLGMSRRVMVFCHTVTGFGDDLAITGDDSAKRTSAMMNAADAQCDRPTHQFFFCHMLLIS